MARPQLIGLHYFPFDVTFFEDRKIKVLRSRFGADGVMVYLYVLCEIYKDQGYYVIADNDFEDVAADDLGMSREKIGQIIHFLAERSLLDSKLFRSDKVLTSHGIQLRYQEAKRDNGRKKPVSVIRKFWVLNEKDTQSFIQYTDDEGLSGIYGGKSENNPPLIQEKSDKEKKSKEKKSKEKQNSPNASAGDGHANVFQVFEDCGFQITSRSVEVLKSLTEDYSEEWVIEAIKRSSDRGKKYMSYIKGILNNWQTAGAIDKPQRAESGTLEKEKAASLKEKADQEAEALIEMEREQMRVRSTEGSPDINYNFLKKF